MAAPWSRKPIAICSLIRLTGLREFIAPCATRRFRPAGCGASPRRRAQQIDAVEDDHTPLRPGRGFDQAKQAEGNGRLAAARLADETKSLAWFKARRRRRPPSPVPPASGSRRATPRRAGPRSRASRSFPRPHPITLVGGCADGRARSAFRQTQGAASVASPHPRRLPWHRIPHDIIDRWARAMIRATILRRDLDAAIGQRRPNGTGSARPSHPGTG